MRRAPSNTISSNIDRDRTTVDSSTATFNIGVPSSPGLHPRSSSRSVKKEGTPRPRTHRRSTTSGHTSLRRHDLQCGDAVSAQPEPEGQIDGAAGEVAL